MSLYQWLALFSVPGLIAGMFKMFSKRLKTLRAQLDAVQLGVQALLRAQLISDWNKYSQQGWAPIYAKENFENCYNQYHNLGANGVMDDIRNKFLALPDRPKQ